jgi:hypothetical protein
LVARGFTQIPGKDWTYDETYSLVMMDVITCKYLEAFAQHHKLSMHQMNIVITYLIDRIFVKIIYVKDPLELIAH